MEAIRGCQAWVAAPTGNSCRPLSAGYPQYRARAATGGRPYRRIITGELLDNSEITRRHFVFKSGAGVGSLWLLSNLPEILLAQQHAHQAAASSAPIAFEFLTADQAAEIEAMAAQIIPTDSSPGAREARVIYFIDRALATFASEERPAFIKGLRELQSRVKKMFKKPSRFSALSSDQQIQLLKSIDKSEFFELVRTMTIFGMFGNPAYGGNHDQIGWKLIGFENEFFFQPPFGFYDNQAS